MDLQVLLEGAGDVFRRGDEKESIELGRNLLLAAQCSTQKDVCRVIRLLTSELASPHPAITYGLLDLAILYPREVIPSVVDLIGDSQEEIEGVLSTFAQLLQEDRSLLTLIVASTSELKLTEDQSANLKDTLVYALSTVEEDDVPAIVNSILRTGASSETLQKLREKTRSLSDGIASLVADVVADASRLNRKTNSLLLEVCGKCQGGVSSVDLIVWGTALCRPRDRGMAVSSVRRAVATNRITTDTIRIIMKMHPSMIDKHAEGLRKLANLLLQLHDEGVSAGVVRTFFLDLFEHSSRSRRTLATDLSSTMCSSNPSSARRAADVVREAAVRGSEKLEAWLHVLLEPLQRPSALNQEAVQPLSSAAALFVAGRKQVATSLLVSVRKQLLFGKSRDKCIGVQTVTAIIPNLEEADARDALELVERAATVPEADVDFAVETLNAVAVLLAKGIRVDTNHVKSFISGLNDVVFGAGGERGVSVKVASLLKRAGPHGHRRVLVASSVVAIVAQTAENPFCFELHVSDETLEYVRTGRPVASRKASTIAELSLTADIYISLVNIYPTKDAYREGFLRKLSQGIELRGKVRKLLPNKSEDEDVQVTGSSAALALTLLEEESKNVELLHSLLLCIPKMLEDELFGVARLPELKAYVERLLDYENRGRTSTASGPNRERRRNEDVRQSPAEEAQLRYQAIGWALRVIVLKSDDAKRLARKVVDSTADSSLASIAVDMAMRCGVSETSAAQLWLRTLSRTFEFAGKGFLPSTPLALNFTSVHDPLFHNPRQQGKLRLKGSRAGNQESVLRYRLSSMFACLGPEARVDEACAWTRVCELAENGDEQLFPEVTGNGIQCVVHILGQVAMASLAKPVSSTSRAAKRVSLLRGLVEVDHQMGVLNACLQLPAAIGSVTGLPGGSECLVGVRHLAQELEAIVESHRESRKTHRSVPKLVLAIDILSDFIEDMEQLFEIDQDCTPLPRSSEDASCIVGRYMEENQKKKRRLNPVGEPSRAPTGGKSVPRSETNPSVQHGVEAGDMSIRVRFR